MKSQKADEIMNKKYPLLFKDSQKEEKEECRVIMTERGILTFIAKVEDELNELDQLKDRIQTVWEKYTR